VKLMRVGVAGQERPAVLHEGVIRDLSGHVEEIDGAFLAGGGVERVARLLEREADRLPVVSADTRVGAPIARPHHLLCIGLNYADHARESNMALPEEPIVFSKAPNTLVGPNDDVLLPPGAEKVDWEVELGVVIGSRARYLKDEAAARACIAGYVLCNDVSERHFQLERGGQWVKGKSCETFNPAGPWLITKDELDDLSDVSLTLSVNGVVRQDGTTAELVFGVDHLVWYLSQFMVLEPGDLINTGTPAGVGLGFDPPVYLQEGDVVELSGDHLGTQRQVCRRAVR
jgi:2,4-diketo-3-deoxy-L-fuconate hydrolase